MTFKSAKLKVGIAGCGAIGSRIGQSIHRELKTVCQLSGLYDIVPSKAQALEKRLSLRGKVKASLGELIRSCDLMVEAVSSTQTKKIIRQALKARKHVLAMSVGQIFNTPDLFSLAKRNQSSLLCPSGALAGIDAIKAASLAKIESITLITRKPPSGLRDNPYLIRKGIDLTKIQAETVLFMGNVDAAVKFFPQNINVAATLALASNAKNKLTIQIITSPDYKTNSHEVEIVGDFGKISTRTENIPCPDNPKTSYLAVLSGIQTLKQFCAGVLIGT